MRISRKSLRVAGDGLEIPLFRPHVAADAGAALGEVLTSGQLAAGPKVAEFERALGETIGNKQCLATSDRSGALTLALNLAGVGPGDEVLMSPLVCLATSMPVANQFARPVWCDIDANTGMLSPADVARRITPKAKAIVLYHWAGDVGPLDELSALAHRHGLALIDDASAAFGAEYHGARVGNTVSDFTVLSFYTANQLATAEGGALFCRSAAHYEAGCLRKRYGIHQPTFRLANGDLNPASDIPAAGYNFAMTNLTAALALRQLKASQAVVNRHRENGQYFDHALRGIAGIQLLQRAISTQSAYWVYALRAERRTALIDKLHAHGVGAQRLHLRNDRYTCFKSPALELRDVARFDADNLCLPCGWWVDDTARERIVDCLRAGW
ncbi:MAG: DegT/DnrJ/EryC1/StrS family aminotransferase [Gammaproteobacteria bacterium]|nr:DegT/DnrJ/EryC1/StrS family aminotransferase [Gammaproteobacteria bacterium]